MGCTQLRWQTHLIKIFVNTYMWSLDTEEMTWCWFFFLPVSCILFFKNYSISPNGKIPVAYRKPQSNLKIYRKHLDLCVCVCVCVEKSLINWSERNNWINLIPKLISSPHNPKRAKMSMLFQNHSFQVKKTKTYRACTVCAYKLSSSSESFSTEIKAFLCIRCFPG